MRKEEFLALNVGDEFFYGYKGTSERYRVLARNDSKRQITAFSYETGGDHYRFRVGSARLLSLTVPEKSDIFLDTTPYNS